MIFSKLTVLGPRLQSSSRTFAITPLKIPFACLQLWVRFLRNHTKDVVLLLSYSFLKFLHYLLMLSYLFYSFPPHPPQAVPLPLKGKAFYPLYIKLYNFVKLRPKKLLEKLKFIVQKSFSLSKVFLSKIQHFHP